MRPVMVANQVDEQSLDFLWLLDLETQHWPNYEPVYFQALVSKYPYQYEEALQYVDQERFKEFTPFDHFEEVYDGEYLEEFLKNILRLGSE